jgi:hypothetical protein
MLPRRGEEMSDARPGGLWAVADGETRDMDLAAVAKAQSANRVAIGAGLVALPSLFGRIWSGREAADERAQVLTRALGARDLTLGLGGLLALREDDRIWAGRAFGAQAVADAIDLLAVLLARGALGRPTRAVATTMAAASAGIAAAFAWRLLRGAG